jgi:hypothetical protein
MKSLLTSALLLGYAIGCFAIPSPLTGAYVKRDTKGLVDEYDYIIVGGGLSGLVVANRLTEDPKGWCHLHHIARICDEVELWKLTSS